MSGPVAAAERDAIGVDSTAAEWASYAAALAVPAGVFHGGEFHEAVNGRTLPVVSPATGRRCGAIADGCASDVDAAVRAAERAVCKREWWRMGPFGRREALLRLAGAVRADRHRLAALITLDQGKAIAQALAEALSAADVLSYFAEALDKVHGEAGPSAPGTASFVVREPFGVVGIVTSWSYPLGIPVRWLAPALAAGNCVVLKPAEEASLAVLRLVELASESGLPPGVLNVVTGRGRSAGAALGRHPAVRHLAFTGSSEAGRQFLRYAGESNMKPVALECGRKSPSIVFADAAELAIAAAAVAGDAFANQGQRRDAGARLLVQRALVERFTELVVREAANWYPGDPFDFHARAGAMISETHLERALACVDGADDDGVTIALGGRRALPESGGFFMEPTIVTQVTNDMAIARAEVAGPLLVVIPFDDDDDAIAIANDSEHGRSAAVWTSDVTRAHRVGAALEADSVYVNRCGLDVTAPLPGGRPSGPGGASSMRALDEHSRTKTTWIYHGRHTT